MSVAQGVTSSNLAPSLDFAATTLSVVKYLMVGAQAGPLESQGGHFVLKKLGRLRQAGRDPDDDDVPPGQFVTEKFPVLTFGATPRIDLETWEFKVFGLVESEKTLSWDQFVSLPAVTVEAPFHCVTQWSRLHNTWEGVAFSEVLKLAGSAPEAGHVMVHCYGGYSTNLPLDLMMDDDVLLAYRHEGEPLTPEHGYPLRLVVPKRYGWKSAKWVNGVELMAEDRPGFWEARGYHMRGDYWAEERFWDSLTF